MYNLDNNKTLRIVSAYTLTQNGSLFYVSSEVVPYIVSINEFEAYHLETCESDEFIQECNNLLN